MFHSLKIANLSPPNSVSNELWSDFQSSMHWKKVYLSFFETCVVWFSNNSSAPFWPMINNACDDFSAMWFNIIQSSLKLFGFLLQFMKCVGKFPLWLDDNSWIPFTKCDLHNVLKCNSLESFSKMANEIQQSSAKWIAHDWTMTTGCESCSIFICVLICDDAFTWEKCANVKSLCVAWVHALENCFCVIFSWNWCAHHLHVSSSSSSSFGWQSCKKSCGECVLVICQLQPLPFFISSEWTKKKDEIHPLLRSNRPKSLWSVCSDNVRQKLHSDSVKEITRRGLPKRWITTLIQFKKYIQFSRTIFFLFKNHSYTNKTNKKQKGSNIHLSGLLVIGFVKAITWTYYVNKIIDNSTSKPKE